MYKTLLTFVWDRSNSRLQSRISFLSINTLSFAVQAICGILISFALALYWDLRAAGIFNVSYGIFAVLGQFAAFGIPESLLEKLCKTSKKNRDRLIFTAAVFSSLYASIPLAIILYVSSDLISAGMNEPELASGFKYIAFSLTAFAFNKNFISFFNVNKMFVSLALVPLIRALSITSVIIVLIYHDTESYSSICISFLIGELITLATSILIFLWSGNRFQFSLTLPEQLSHLKFGTNVIGYSGLTEIFFRVDVLTIPFIFNSTQVGIYTLAALVAEGVIQIAYIFRQVMIPEFKKLLQDSDLKHFKQLCHITSFFSLLICCFVGGSALLFLVFLNNFVNHQDFSMFVEIAGVLVLGSCIYSIAGPVEIVGIVGNAPKIQAVYLIMSSTVSFVSVLIISIHGNLSDVPFGMVLGYLSCLFFVYGITIPYVERKFFK